MKRSTLIDLSNWLTEISRHIQKIKFDTQRSNTEKPDINCERVFYTQQTKCTFCNENHSLEKFVKFRELDQCGRFQIHQLCFSCLSKGHYTKNCKRKKYCRVNNCRYKHHFLIHMDIHLENTIKSAEVPEIRYQNINKEELKAKSSVLFQMIPVKIFGPRGSFHTNPCNV